MPSLNDWQADYRRWGLARTLYKRVMLGLRPWLVLCEVHSRPLSYDPPPSPPEGFEVRVATEAELLAAVDNPELGLSEAFVRSAFERGDMCVATFQGDRIVAQLWRSFTCAPHNDGLWVRFRKPHRYGYKAYTAPEFRGRHLQDPMSSYLDRYSIDRGYTHTIGFVETHNYPSLASDKRRGHRCLGYVGYVKLFGRVFPFSSRGARAVGFGFVPADSEGPPARAETRSARERPPR